MSMTINGTSGLVFNDASTQNTAATGFGFKNRIINGAMMLNQRAFSGAVTATAFPWTYTMDRWMAITTQASKITISQNAGSVTPPVGFRNYLGVTSSAATSVGSGDNFSVQQRIEGFNISDLGWGAAGASPVTLSFWVRSSLTGTFGGAINNGSDNRSYPFTYTISAANTWEQKTITVAGDTTGTWATDNSVGLTVNFGLGVGSTLSGTAGAWSGSSLFSATGATSVVGTNGATFYITGVQLEKGSTATSFDYRPYGTELSLCQRYCVVFTGLGGGARFGSGYYNSSTIAFNTNVPIATPLRASPTVTASDMTIGIQGAAPTISSISGISYNANIPNVNFISNTSTGTDGAFGQMRVNATTSSLTISAEL